MTVWGDSLSDLIDFYGAVPFNYFGFVPRADYGNEPGFIDSFGDYFTLFGDLMAAITILSFDEEAARSSARIRKNLEKIGKRIGAYDI